MPPIDGPGANGVGVRAAASEDDAADAESGPLWTVDAVAVLGSTLVVALSCWLARLLYPA
jgi:hypothetical protein